MKKTMIVLSAVLALVACNKVTPDTENNGTIDASKVVFNFSINNADATKAVKSGWENGDKVFIFFNGITTAHVTTAYNGTAWTPTLNGSATLPASGKLTAVYLPYGNGLTASYSSNWTFSEPRYTYYMVAKDVDYTISNVENVSTLSATINMNNPGGFVHFYVADAAAADGAYTLASDAVIPAGIASVSSAGAVTETEDKNAGDAMVGYKYGEGYSFSGKVNSNYKDNYNNNLAGKYYFIKTKVADSSREDYFTSAGTLVEKMAISLPANGSDKWIAVGADKWVDLGHSTVKFATCNYNQTVPEAVGTTYTYNDAIALVGVSLPDKDQMEWLNNDANNTWNWMKVNGQTGMVVSSKTTSGFLFLPANLGGYGYYWSSTPYDEDYAWSLYFCYDGFRYVYCNDRGYDYCVRPVQNK